MKPLGNVHMARRNRSVLACSLLLLCSWPAHADERGYFGLLRARDLTPFGFLRLDMRPAHAVSAPAGTRLRYLCIIHPWMIGTIKVV